ncbi:type II toxin-antitoxin system RelE/ParE family toxin [Algoriphagus sp. H41]|uniref:Type II toxin-antitoxin system RelE/ParE family toxin n=1 Tax=Algoriphagus oliviformis TaxID=2811231 RepID=A0ABS3C2A1_9BACT|nr:type II toxin-antitoxin system RelE/ParE family toxin [Algoriphagus oliviformis]MBN7811083.1 type II toxin-antitoxin system RelE/ParE family toxin [Algoriphagus oliviformis]
MAKKRVVWTAQAENDRIDILTYWRNRNKSSAYSAKLHQLFKEGVLLIQANPTIGKPTNIDGIRSKIVRDYLIFYEEMEDEIVILAIWDNRRNPTKLKI